MATDIFYFQQFEVHQSHAAMKVGTDSDLLGALAAGGDKILDIGTGTGVLSLMLAQRYPAARITAIEIDDGAVTDARQNFEISQFRERLTLLHTSFQDYLAAEGAESESFDSIVCNPPYFDRSLECDKASKTRARHTSSLPFETLVRGAYSLLAEGGRFSVCIPPEVWELFRVHCIEAGFQLETIHQINTLPQRPVKRIVLICRKSREPIETTIETHNMLTPDSQRSEWYLEIMGPFLIYGGRK